MPTLYKIFVNATALTSGGGLVTLRQFLDNIQPKDDCFYYVFCSVNYLPSMYKKDNVKFIFPKYRKGVARLYWDYIGLKRWSVSNYTVPDLVISLQNTTIFFDKHTPQISYIMQSIPFVDKQWNVFNKRERILWFYQNIYPFLLYGLVKYRRVYEKILLSRFCLCLLSVLIKAIYIGLYLLPFQY